MKILNMVIPILMHFLTFIRQRHSILHQTEALSATWNNYVIQSQATSFMTSVFRRYIAEYTDAKFWRFPIRRRVTFASALEWPTHSPLKSNSYKLSLKLNLLVVEWLFELNVSLVHNLHQLASFRPYLINKQNLHRFTPYHSVVVFIYC